MQYRPVQQRHQGRRVGTVTMACALIAVGVLLIIGSFNQSISFLMMARLAPIILIVLGIEILFRYFVSKGEKLRYDFLSGFVCFILIIGSLGMAAIPEVWNQLGPPSGNFGGNSACRGQSDLRQSAER